jgi:hypothetical protein
MTRNSITNHGVIKESLLKNSVDMKRKTKQEEKKNGILITNTARWGRECR